MKQTLPFIVISTEVLYKLKRDYQEPRKSTITQIYLGFCFFIFYIRSLN